MSEWLLPAVKDWAEWVAIFTDVGLWRPVVDQLWQQDDRLRAASGINVPARVESGYPGTCAVFVVDETAVIKFFPPMVARDFDRELAVYQLIHGRVARTPALLAHGRFHDRIEWPYLVVSRLPGEAWREEAGRVETVQATGVMAELGRIIRAVHAIPLPTAGAWPAASAWETLVTARLAQAGDDLRRGTVLAEPVIARIELELSRMNWYGDPVCLLHSDLTEDHLLVAEVGGRWSITGLIDWADAEVGPAAYDWVTLWFSICRRNFEFYRSFFRGYGPQAIVFGQQLAAMTYLHRFGANIIGDVLSREQQRAIGSVAKLNQALFGALARTTP